MTDEREFPLIGPHEGQELELMLAGRKPAALFYDLFPSEEFLPKEKFTLHIKEGRILHREVLYHSKKLNGVMTYIFYALPEEAWRIDRLEELHRSVIEGSCDQYEIIDREIGNLLGYSNQAIDYFLEKQKKRLSTKN